MRRDECKTVLVAEDDDIDAIAIEKAIELYSNNIKIIRAIDGEDTLNRLASATPDLVLMDIKMPRMDGREALVKIKSDITLMRMPVVMMSTSDDESDINYCYQNNCNAYVVKPIGFDMSTAVVKSILDFWLKTAVH